MRVPSQLRSVLEWLRTTRCKWLLLLTLLCLALRENYPFSHFPMYSTFGDHSYFLYLADAQGRPVPTRSFGLSSSALKKIFDRQRRKNLKDPSTPATSRVSFADKAAAESLLHYLDGIGKSRPFVARLLPGVQVQHVSVRQKNGALITDTRTLARHP